jgi:hypothetical protein
MPRVAKVIIFLSLVICATSIAYASVPHQISLQGRLLDSLGMVVRDTTHTVTFRIYSDSVGYSVLWQEMDSIRTKYGLFQTQLGSQIQIPDSIFNGNSRFLGIQLDSNPEMPGRLPIKSEAYSYRATFADSVIGPGDSDWAFSDSNIYRLNGNVGIGTTEPSTKLHVNGKLRANAIGIGPGAPWTDNGIYLDAGFQTTRLAWSNRTNCDFHIYEDGPAQKLIFRSYGGGSAEEWKWISAGLGDLFTIGPNIIMNRNVGIGTDYPSYSLDVAGDVHGTDITLGGANNPNVRLIWGTSDYRWEVGEDGGFYLYDQNANSYRMFMLANGNLGIGTTSPRAKLEVKGDMAVNSQHSPRTTLDVGGAISATNSVRIYGDMVNFHELRHNGTSGNLEIAPIGGTNLVLTNGNLGLGTAIPAYALDVLGSGRFSNHVWAGIASDLDPKNPFISADGNTSGCGVAGRCNSPSYYGVWGYNSNGIGIGCGTESASYPALQANSYGSLAGNEAIHTYGQINSDGRVRASSGISGINAIEGRCSSDYAGVAGINSSNGAGVYGTSASGYAGNFSGPVYVSGYLSKAGGGFKIDHPTDPDNKYLYHSFVESPDMKNIYDGIVMLDQNGEATVELPSYFDALNQDCRYQLTCIGGYANIFVAEEINNNHFKISGGKPGLKVSWQVTGVRHDAWANSNRIGPEVDKASEDRGKYLHPKELGKSESLQIGAQIPATEGEKR